MRNYSALNLEFSSWLETNSAQNVRSAIKRTLADKQHTKTILIVTLVLMLSELALAYLLFSNQAKLLLTSPILNIFVYGLIGKGLLKSVSRKHPFENFLIRHFNEFDSAELIYTILINIVQSKDSDLEDKVIANIILGRFDPNLLV